MLTWSWWVSLLTRTVISFEVSSDWSLVLSPLVYSICCPVKLSSCNRRILKWSINFSFWLISAWANLSLCGAFDEMFSPYSSINSHIWRASWVCSLVPVLWIIGSWSYGAAVVGQSCYFCNQNRLVVQVFLVCPNDCVVQIVSLILLMQVEFQDGRQEPTWNSRNTQICHFLALIALVSSRSIALTCTGTKSKPRSRLYSK